MSKYSHVMVLISRQRSGTNALRGALESHPDLYCLNAVFNLNDSRSDNVELRETNYFTFLKEQIRIDPDWILPDRQEELFCNFLDYLASRTKKRMLMIDVKLNTAHLLTPNWQGLRAFPFFFELIVKLGMRPMILTRKNYLRYQVSLLKARRSREYTLAASAGPKVDTKVRIPVKQLLNVMTKCEEEDATAYDYFTSRTNCLVEDYTNVFPPSGAGMRESFRRRLCEWLDIPDSFSGSNYFQKLSSLPLSETIENWDDVVETLQGTRFAYCLKDEHFYEDRSGVQPATV